MNRAKIKQILNTPGLNFYQSVHSNKMRHFSYFNPYTSEMVEFDCHEWRKNGVIDLHICNVKYGMDMVPHHQNYIKSFRSFVLATLIGGMKRHNNARLVLCKSESAAKRYSNLGGVVVCIKNPKGGTQWGIVK